MKRAFAVPGPAHPGAPVSPLKLARLVSSIASQPGRWQAAVRVDPARRRFARLELTTDLEVWLLSWLPGQGTGFHDHGTAAGAFTVAHGELTERTVPAGRAVAASRVLAAGQARPFGPAHVHDVVNSSAAPAVSVHAYSPPLTAMRRFELTAGGLVHISTDPAEAGWLPRPGRPAPGPPMSCWQTPAAGWTGSAPARPARRSRRARCWWTSARQRSARPKGRCPGP